MKKKIYIGLTSLVALPSLFAATQVFAADDPVPTNPGPGTETTNLATKIGDSVGYLSTNDTPALANSVVEFKVDPGYLTLDAVPDFSFEKTSVTALGSEKGANLKLNGFETSGADPTSKGVDSFDGNKTGLIQVSDFRGTLAGWKLSASLKDFTTKATVDGASPTISGTLQLAAAGVQAPFQGADISKGSTTIANAAEGTSNGVFKDQLTTDSATLALAQQPKAIPGSYQSTLTWTLAATPDATAPGSNTGTAGSGGNASTTTPTQ
ncbi:WxL domain-containing protein [Agrilactobacillus fermenti]|uniref:WxL domain-containing protein n=1 Tax=Agrilactobacillus fermenti TaxID=2586909 RepID=UPI001E283B69|nr:WxL domain-containing protein [Agrilactobacillus fermenti]MCD2256626.1 WxL domain-containing protein [Agrilactobacillus fermenti]